MFNFFRNHLSKAVRCSKTPQQFQNKIVPSSKYNEKYTMQRTNLTLYDLVPQIEAHGWVAPSCIIAGEVLVYQYAYVKNNCVLRGDINAVVIGDYSIVGENCVLHTAGCLPNGQPAITVLGNSCFLAGYNTLYSCELRDYVQLGANTVVLEGAVIEEGSIIGPNSVVPPGRLIPAGQVWAGNPVRYVRDMTPLEQFKNKEQTQKLSDDGDTHNEQFMFHNNSYLLKENVEDDKIDNSKMRIHSYDRDDDLYVYTNNLKHT